jgi:hypothetical protein
MRTGIAVMALIDHEGLAETVHVNLIGAEQIDDVDFALLRPVHDATDVAAAIARHEAKLEATDPRRRIMQQIEAVPVRTDDVECL